MPPKLALEVMQRLLSEAATESWRFQ